MRSQIGWLGSLLPGLLFGHQHELSNAQFRVRFQIGYGKPNDLKEDFIPYMPSLYPGAPQFRDLSGDDATSAYRLLRFPSCNGKIRR
jgi:hypothetical protein